MNRFRSIFKNKHTVLPVVHVSELSQALRNVAIVVEGGADGAFLINHACEAATLFEIYQEVRTSFPDLWVGLNLLDLEPLWPVRYPSVAGAWADSAYILELKEEQHVAENIRHCLRDITKWEGLYFGGVAFKGQRKVRPEHLTQAAQKSLPFLDVVTTSGPGTGRSAPLEKIRVMKEAIGDFPLAIASGITPENVAEYLPHADCFLVASGISDDFENLSLSRTRDLVERVKGK